MEIKLIKITDENRDSLTDLALSQYIGEFCRICGRHFISLEVLKEAHPVCCGKNPLRFACKECFDKNKLSPSNDSGKGEGK